MADFTPPTTFSEPEIIHKIYKFYLKLSQQVTRFPKKDRYTIGARCEQVTLLLLKNLYRANTQADNVKIPFLKETDVQLSMLKMFVRLAHDSQAIDQKKYIDLQTWLQEIGKMLGGWIKSLK